MGDSKSDKIIWWLMVTFLSIIVVGGGAWGTNINEKVEINSAKVSKIESSLDYMQKDINDIKNMFQEYLRLTIKGFTYKGD